MRQAEYTSFLATLVVSVWTTQLRFFDLVDFRVGRAEHPVCDDDLASVRRDVCLRGRACDKRWVDWKCACEMT